MAKGQKIWWNGNLVDLEEAKISLFTHTLHYGVGAFEGIRAYRQTAGGGAIFRLAPHIQRLFETCKILNIEIPSTQEEVREACLQVCRENQFDECYIRPIVYIGDGPLGLNLGENPPVEIAVLSWEWGSYLGDEGIEKGVRLKTSSFLRPQVNSVMTKGKINGQYVTGCLAKREAIQDGYDEGILLDTEGYVSEGSGENLFFVKDGIIKTTPLNSILNGITRNSVIEILSDDGHVIREVRFSRDELWTADEVFMTGTAAEITPVREIDRRQIGSGNPGPVTQKLQRDYQALIRGDHQRSEAWTTKI